MSVKSAPLAALAFAYKMNGLEGAPSIVRSTRPEFGDLQCNDMMRLAKSTGRNPRVLAAAVAEAIPNTFSRMCPSPALVSSISG
ncbi:hypothetical protein [Rhizobium sp. RCAM05973]|uniref:hypothetical protein n=1 Tax=Rhizobium sp. RCAM05973 TaxID=2994066 RepID=UPI0022EBDCDD|nr:hypothetical protein [Rhizobium sp. RCAM05973]